MYLRSFFAVGAIILIGMLLGNLFRDSRESLPPENSEYWVGRYHLYDPEMAPAEIKDQVMRGFHIMMETRSSLPENAGDKISCTNCHFSGGNTFGGRKGGLSLVGVVHEYPKTLESGKKFTLAERMNSCFMRSLNGKPLSLDSPDMNALVTYLEWISKGIPKRANYPWMGTKKLRTRHTPDPKNGAKIYEMNCALCHGKNGEGQERPYDLSYPPLWGDYSFNDGAGMNTLETFAYFVYENMPYNDPELTVEDALDVASFVIRQPRPKLAPK